MVFTSNHRALGRRPAALIGQNDEAYTLNNTGIRVLIIDDHVKVSERLARRLAMLPGLEVAGTTANAKIGFA